MLTEAGHVSLTSMSDNNCHLSPTPFMRVPWFFFFNLACNKSGEKFENYLLDLRFVDNRLVRDLLVEKSLNG